MLGRTLDELPPQTRRLLRLIHGMVQDLSKQQGMPAREVRFTRRTVREATGLSDGQLKIHCTRLTEMEYLLVHGGSRGHALQYELMYDGHDDDAKRLCGLIDPAELDAAELDRPLDNDARKSGADGGKSAPSQAQVTLKSGSSQTAQSEVPQGLQTDSPHSPLKARIQGNGGAPCAAGVV